MIDFTRRLDRSTNAAIRVVGNPFKQRGLRTAASEAFSHRGVARTRRGLPVGHHLIKNRVHEKMSRRRSASFLSACSGDIYWSVPTIIPSAVSAATSPVSNLSTTRSNCDHWRFRQPEVHHFGRALGEHGFQPSQICVPIFSASLSDNGSCQDDLPASRSPMDERVDVWFP